MFPAETPEERAQATKSDKEKEMELLAKLKEYQNKLQLPNSLKLTKELLEDVKLYKEYEEITKELKKKKLAISDWKLTEYD